MFEIDARRVKYPLPKGDSKYLVPLRAPSCPVEVHESSSIPTRSCSLEKSVGPM